tara:strand:+ start:154 stop:471 length:318 start_codon:yes stop_codon:yes gene_type:complete
MVGKAFRNAGILGKIYTVGDLLYKEFFKKREDAEKQYKNLYPLLKITYGQSGRDASEFINLLNVFLSLTPVGAKRRNFKRRYIDDKEGWRKLPSEPAEIPYGHWW